MTQPTAPPARTPAIALAELGKRYGDVTALHPVDLAVDTGARVALVGHNGSGKSTLIRMLAGVLEPTTGSATVAGHAAGSLPARAALSYLADQPVFYDDLSLLEHLEYVARLHGRDAWRTLADELLSRFELAGRSDDLPMTFSRGLQQKAAICLAFIRPFDVLVVDEPFVGLDVGGRTALVELFDEAQREGRTLLVATHELTTVSSSDRVLALRDGHLHYDGRPDTDLSALVDSG